MSILLSLYMDQLKGTLTFSFKMKHGSKMASSKSCIIFLCSLFLVVVEITSTPLPAETLRSQNAPQGKQGILEIPKQAATIIRNYIDSSIKHYFNITTPVPLNNVPPELKDSIVGNFLLGNLYSPLPPAPAYNPAAQQPEVKPIAISNEPSFAGHAQLVEPTTASPPPGELPSETSTKRAKPSRDKVHVLDTDTSLSGIYNSYGLQINGGPDTVSAQPSSKPSPQQQTTKTPNAEAPNPSYGLLVNKNPGDEIYWIPDATRPSIVIPIQTSTTPQSEAITESEPTTEAVEITTEDEEEEGVGEEEEVFAFKKKL